MRGSAWQLSCWAKRSIWSFGSRRAFVPLGRTRAIAGGVQWNFQKCLVGRDGTVVAKWGPKTMPDDKAVVEAVEKALAAERPKGG